METSERLLVTEEMKGAVEVGAGLEKVWRGRKKINVVGKGCEVTWWIYL